MSSKDPELDKLKKELDTIIESIKAAQKKGADADLVGTCADVADAPRIHSSCRRVLKGHINKVNGVHYSGDSRHAVSGSLDGKLIIWDTWTGNKTQIIPLRSAWVMATAFAPSGNFIASGGMDNQVTIHDLNNRDSNGQAKVIREISAFEGFLSCARFLSDSQIVTGSADMKIVLWDVQVGKNLGEFNGHEGDVVTLSINADATLFVTGSVDRTAKLWDVRTPGWSAQQTFWGHESDVNSVCFHPSGHAFATCSEDKTTRLFDLRADQQLAQYAPPTPNSAFTCCGLSRSGRLALAGSDDNTVHIWDTLKAQHLGNLAGHEGRITSLSVAESGVGFCTTSWDTTVRVWY
ncbi:guanine nucleotide-binding protein subunit beta-2-like [Amphibalanus amphitrite]|uniref:guanine nucleotide-binding protein subunit beta-2-like n=1 Tax=Amphibalanus amphitrite TaxID=1232801 RepID=UPI001C8FCB29|nr:guanine nucleotide-binding protein subunit beta-2-like [Amphibalanus amphitrite]XP_043236669.1 guanine nucleotide-binding protein subunit beta-2-like [Amphibalanus amphitrite]